MKRKESLVQQFAPEKYKLTLIPAKGDTDAEGLVTITGRKLPPPSRRLVFHQRHLKITRAEIHAQTKKGEQEIHVARINHHKSFEQVRLHTKETLYPGNYEVTTAFIVKLSADTERPEVINAAFKAGESLREFFPCIDEPEALRQATLEISKE